MPEAQVHCSYRTKLQWNLLPSSFFTNSRIDWKAAGNILASETFRHMTKICIIWPRITFLPRSCARLVKIFTTNATEKKWRLHWSIRVSCLKSEYGVSGFVDECFNAPPAIKAVLCRDQKLWDISVGGLCHLPSPEMNVHNRYPAVGGKKLF